MAIRDTPAQCVVGDGVLASNVLYLDGFHNTRTVVQFLPEKQTDPFTPAVVGKAPVEVEAPTPWIFALRKYQIEGGEVVDAWQRES
jgi:hypothetical protein